MAPDQRSDCPSGPHPEDLVWGLRGLRPPLPKSKGDTMREVHFTFTLRLPYSPYVDRIFVAIRIVVELMNQQLRLMGHQDAKLLDVKIQDGL